MNVQPLNPDFAKLTGEMPKEFISGITESKPNRQQNYIPLLIAIGTFAAIALWMYYAKQEAKLLIDDKN